MSSPSSGSVSTWLVIIGVFVAGALGGAAVRSFVGIGSEDRGPVVGEEEGWRGYSAEGRRSQSPNAFRRSDRFMEHLVKNLELRPEQADEMRAILDERERETSALFESIEPRLREAVKRTESEVREVLDGEQRDRFDEIVREGRRRHRDRGDGRGGSGPPSGCPS